ncbi:hypothetical protein [Paenibacillus glufosinatiresistens]|uniref:hypothetical protein n=1 Tax=Paenibacillus glufosinatiresistens TaxID=3070657 RepID=UPI00286EA0BC|nr:hypothetical protein [Paenibacillus sp. YX.27]
MADINRYTLWRLNTAQREDEEGYQRFEFEAWLATDSSHAALWDRLKVYVDTYTGSIDWHVCLDRFGRPAPDHRHGGPCRPGQYPAGHYGAAGIPGDNPPKAVCRTAMFVRTRSISCFTTASRL